MKRWLEKIHLRRAIGLYHTPDAVILTEVAATPAGPVVLSRERRPFSVEADPDELKARLEESAAGVYSRLPASVENRLRLEYIAELEIASALGSHLAPRMAASAQPRGRRRDTKPPKRPALQVGIALPMEQCYYATHEVATGTPGEGLAEEEINERLRMAAFQIGRLIHEQLPLKAGARTFATLTACSRRALENLTGRLRARQLPEPFCAPFHWAVVRAAMLGCKPPTGKGAWVWVSLDESNGLAALMHETRPLTCRGFDFAPGSPGNALKANVLLLLLHATRELGMDPPAAVQLHADGERLNRALPVLEELSLKVDVRERHPDHAAEASLGAALNALLRPSEALNLGRALRPPSNLRDLIPWGDLTFSTALVVILWLVMNFQLVSLRQSVRGVARDNARYRELQQADDTKTKQEAAELANRIHAYNSFFANRVRWADYLRQVPVWLPARAYLTGMLCQAELPEKKKGKTEGGEKNGRLQITGGTAFPPDGSAPHEIDEFLQVLRDQPMLKKTFPIVELGEVQWRKEAIAGAAAQIYFTVVCLPRQKYKAIKLPGEAMP